jgi:hypothetical protein
LLGLQGSGNQESLKVGIDGLSYSIYYTRTYFKDRRRYISIVVLLPLGRLTRV